ncbi:hypothetical protein B0H17DRAFT_1328232 [Mycena rosella]|uniref:Transmembrane protein n=1 Tax=Mycena rosella TaxID=1033263 RepID=A0AAD7GPQ3_MYCRO|nr:hypothetical protein B0H17DRAFT_1328232 [Mycena rosella]
MPAISEVLSRSVSVGSHSFSPKTVHRILVCGAIASAVLFVCCFVFVSVPKLLGPRRKSVDVEEVKCGVAVPQRVYLRPDISLPEYPFDHPRRPSPAAPLPKARTAGQASQIYRYPGNCWNQERLAGRQQRPEITRPSPLRNVTSRPLANAVLNEPKVAKLNVAQVLETYSNTLPPADHLAPVFPSLDCIGPAFKFALVPILDTPPAPARASPAKSTPKSTPLFKWGTVTHTLELPLRGNKMARAPLTKSRKNMVTTNVVFSKNSVFYTPTAADKENTVYAQSVDTVV